MSPVRLTIAGLTLELRPRGGTTFPVPDAWRGFLTDETGTPGARPWVVEVETRPEPVPIEGLHITPVASNRGEFIHVTQGPVFDLTLALARRRADIAFSPCPQDDEPGRGPVALRGAVAALCALALPHQGGFLLHGAGIRDRSGEQAVAAFGPSGAGKSTLCQDFPDSRILNDELLAVVLDANSATVHSTPFSGTLDVPRQNAGLTLAALVSLGQGPHCAVEVLSPSEGFAALLSCAAVPTGAHETERRVFELVHRLVERAPPRRLLLSLDPGARAETLAGLWG